MLCHGLQDIVSRFMIYHATAYKISPRDLQNIVSRFIRCCVMACKISCHGLWYIMRRLIRYLLATYKISCHGLQDIVSRRSAAMYPTEPGSFSASEVTVRMGRIRHTLPALLLFRTMTPAFSVQYIRLSRPFYAPHCASPRAFSCCTAYRLKPCLSS